MVFIVRVSHSEMKFRPSSTTDYGKTFAQSEQDVPLVLVDRGGKGFV